ncbi:MAG: hypothetical protein HY689_13045 [Chloroflexi bacterium]|nr:hypothetical protein [Chloroflexota bacterium]
MDPRFVTAPEWATIVPMIVSLWAFAGTMVLFAFSLMLGHAVIPSLVGTHHLPARAASLRPFLYTLAVISFALAAFILLNLVANLLGPIYGIYPKVWL